jgi:hypothetical protein
MSDIPSFLDYLFGQREGWACLGAIDGDPQVEGLTAKNQEWFAWPDQRGAMICRAEWHAEQGHNLYVRQTLFSKKRGTQTNALPSPIIWQDDSRADTPASVLIESSKGNYQALITLDREATTAERKRMMRAWRNARPGADDCSANPVAFVRVPGGYNRKRHGDWLVRYAVQSARIYTADKLLARCGAGKGETQSFSPAGGLDRAQLDHWQAHIEQLLNDDRTLPRAFVRDTPGRRILELRASGKGMLFHASGTWDASRERLWLANSLVMARYLDAQIAALLWHFEVTETVEIKGEAAVWADIHRVIAMARTAHPNITPRLYGPRPAAKTKVARGRAGSHAALVERVYQLLVEHRAGAQAIIKTGEIAGVIGCHRRTIVTILNELRDAKRIETASLGQHGGLVVTFSGVIYSELPSAVQPVTTPEVAVPATALGETGSLVGCVSPDRAEADHTLPRVGYGADGQRLGLAELVRDGLDAVTRPTLKRVRAYVLANAANPAAYTENSIATVYRRELERRRWARQDARLVEKVRALRSDVLKRKSRSIASQAANLHRRGDKRALVYQRLAGIYAAEEARRAPPDQLTLHEQWAEVGAEYEQAHQALKKYARPVAKAAPAVEPPAPEAWALIDRLRARKEAARVE